MTWAGACAGMLLANPEAAQAMGFIVFLPLSFVSNAFVPTQGMPGWLRAVANWNPLSAVAASCRDLFATPTRPPRSAPMQHPELATVFWSVGLTVLSAPLAVRLYRRKALG
jgi:ABC-2 type transport system permease protein